MKKHSVMSLILCFSACAFAATPKLSTNFPEGERLVYTKLIEAFHRNQLDEVTKERQILEKNYPLSVHLGNAYYLNGMLEYQNNRLGEALKSFDAIANRDVKSNKRPAALFAMGMTYQRLNLAPQAHRVFAKIMKEYPGSPESQRAWMQLRLEKQPKTIKR